MPTHRFPREPQQSPGEIERVLRARRFQWFILGALGVAPYACGGRTGVEDTGISGGEQPVSGGGTAGSSPVAGGGVGGYPTGTGGAGGYAGDWAGAGTGAYPTYGGAGGAPHPTPGPLACENATAVGGGWERCGNGTLHRAQVGVCESNVPRPGLVRTPAGYETAIDAGVILPCREDADCTDDAYGHCEWGQSDFYGTYCEYGCVQDSDCSDGLICVCGQGPVGRCAPATCETDADCGGQGLCADYTMDPGCGGMAFACTTPSDECAVDFDCPSFEMCTLFSGSQHRVCSGAVCVIGRPFLIDGRERLATARERGDWCAELEEASASIDDPELRAAVSRGWIEQGLMEHASVAAFARFSLQLLSLGAPPDLITRAADAMQDEIRHARACFALARRHTGEDVGPGPLSVDGALDCFDLTNVVLDTIAEGCIGETVAALEAAEALSHCEDPAAREVLRRISVEEGRHAELAWQFVSWALETGPESLKERVRGAFIEALAGARREPVHMTPRDRDLLRHGLVSEGLRGPLRAGVLAEVVGPCAKALLEGEGMRPVREAREALAVA